MVSEQELKSQCTPDIIKKMAELADGFRWHDGRIIFCNFKYFISDVEFDEMIFPLLIHRACEGWNNKQKDETCIIIGENYNVVWWESDLKISKSYDYKDYQPENLTALECAMLDCLIEILKEEVW